MSRFIDTKQFKRIISKLGEAVWSAQRLEHSLSYLMIVANEEVYGTDKMDEYQLNLNKKTLGQLINKLKEEIEIEDSLSELLKSALEARNYVAHKFGNDRVNSLTTRDGCKESITILDEKIYIINNAYNEVFPMIEDLMRARGVDVEHLTNVVEYEILIDKIKNAKNNRHQPSRANNAYTGS